MPGSESDPVQLDPFQEVTEVNWSLRPVLVIDYGWAGTDARDLETVTTVSGFEPVGFGYGDSLYHEGRSAIIWSGDLGSAETVEVWGREIQKMAGVGTVSITCAAHWDDLESDPAEVLLTVVSYIKSRPPFTYGEERQRYDTSKIISNAFNSPEAIAQVEFDLRTGRFTVS